jgi:uncharacterized protein YlxW (UPF0749 family)
MTEERDRSGFGTQALVDLVLDPRELGYEAAAQRNGGTPARHWYDRPAIAAGCLVVGFLLAVAWVHTHRGAPEEAKVHDSLVDRVRTAQHADDALADTQAKLNSELNKVRAAALPGSSTLVTGLMRSQLLAGETAVQGPGLQVRLSEPTQSSQPTGVPGPGAPTPTTTGHILIDRDVRSVVNELWADGAEAISVNGVRLTPTSAIRFAGDAVLVDFQPIASPYVIDAIGDSDRLDTGFASSTVASRYQTLASARGIGFTFTQMTKLNLPPGTESGLRYAHVVTH